MKALQGLPFGVGPRILYDKIVESAHIRGMTPGWIEQLAMRLKAINRHNKKHRAHLAWKEVEEQRQDYENRAELRDEEYRDEEYGETL